MFQKRHYEAIAARITKPLEYIPAGPRGMVVEELAEMFERDNPAFDRHRFIKAVYYPLNGK